jgi:hypothetical protein
MRRTARRSSRRSTAGAIRPSGSRSFEEGLFGATPSDALRTRLADVVCLPYLGEAVYWLEPGRFEQRFNGQHGGLTPEEMDIPLVAHVTG